MRDTLDRNSPNATGAAPGTAGPGTVLHGRYELGSLIGRGGMADVYRAHDRVLDRLVAVKVLRAPVGADPGGIGAFLREAQAVASLAHSNIVAVHDAGTEADAAFIVMEFVPGEALSDVLSHEERLPPARAAEIGRAVAEALAAAHDRGVVHRDVKPSNVLITPSGWVKVLDFGIARARGGDAEVRAGFATAAYASPEQAAGTTVDERSDIYALGVMLFEMLSGRLPSGAKESPSTLLPAAVPSSLSAVVDRCLERSPERRYQTARQVARDLALAGRTTGGATAPLLGPRDTDPLPPPVVSGRGFGYKLAAVAVVVGLIGGALSMAAFIRREAPAPRHHRAPQLLPPGGLRLAAGCDGFLATRVEVRWVPSSNPAVDGYSIYRSESADGPWMKVDLVEGRSARSFVDHELGTSAVYFYVLRATSGSRLSGYTLPAEVRTPSFCLF
jgi:serine/threonine-protein kinase